MKNSKEINRYVLPLILTHLAQFLISQLALHYAIGDSSLSLSGVSIIQNFLFAFGGILGAFSLAFNIKGARAIGNHEQELFYNLTKSSFMLVLMIGLCFLVISLLFGPSILGLFYGFEGELLSLSTTYLTIISPYILLTLLTFLLATLLKVEKKTQPIFWIALASSIIDVLLNYYLVPIYGIAGAAIAAILSLLLIVLSYFVLVYRTFFEALKRKSTTKKQLIFFGIPLVFQEILESFLFILVFDALMGRQSIHILSVYAVVSQLFSLARLPVFMYAGAIPIFLPETEKDDLQKRLIKTISVQAFLAYLLFSFIVIVFANSFATFLSTKIDVDILPFTLYTMLAMIGTPAYECTKIFLQSKEMEGWVLIPTACVNIIGILLLILIQFLGIQSYYTLYGVYGLTLLTLGLLFRKAKHRAFPRQLAHLDR